jgi:hypothetical protein
MYPPNLEELFPQYTQSQLEEILNTLPMNQVDFSRISDMYELMFGVKTGSKRAKDSHLNPIVANSCLRQALLESIVAITSETENQIGFIMKDRYISEEVPLIFGRKLETSYGGVEAMNVIREWATVAGMEAEPVIYKTVDPVTMEDDGGKYYAHLPVSEVPNPGNTWIRREAGDGAFSHPASESTSWVANAGDPYWRVPVDTATQSYTPPEVVYAHDRQYAFVDITPPVLDAGETLAPVFPGTNLMIPLARPVDVLAGGDHRYWFYLYTLVHPDLYYDEKISLEDAPPEFWKFLPTIEFRKWYETLAPMTVTVVQGDNSDTYEFDPADPNTATINAFLISPETGVFHFSVDPGFSLTTYCGDYTPTSAIANIHYKVSPSLLADHLRKQITSIIRAISYRVAAELPMVSCDCIMETGFLAEQRRETGTVHRNLFTQIDKYQIAYGKRIGIDAYHAIMSKMSISRTMKPII